MSPPPCTRRLSLTFRYGTNHTSSSRHPSTTLGLSRSRSPFSRPGRRRAPRSSLRWLIISRVIPFTLCSLMGLTYWSRRLLRSDSGSEPRTLGEHPRPIPNLPAMTALPTVVRTQNTMMPTAPASGTRPPHEEDESHDHQVSFTTTNSYNNNNDKIEAKQVEVVHVILTRFMQHQPHLLALGQARLRLFQTTCWASLTQQTPAAPFLWIIRTDPQLPDPLRRELMDLLQNSSMADTEDAADDHWQHRTHVLLVGSNMNPEGFRDPLSIQDITSESLWVGSEKVLAAYHQAAQSTLVLETRLDADDALWLGYVDYMQKAAAQADWAAGIDWRVWCVQNHLEWQYDAPWTPSSWSSSSASVSDEENRSQPVPTGSLLGLRSSHCITPGLTWGYGVNVTSRKDIPVKSHHAQLHQAIPRCSHGIRRGRRLVLDVRHSGCLDLIQPVDRIPVALRARTPTSAGMDGVFLRRLDLDPSPHEEPAPRRRRRRQRFGLGRFPVQARSLEVWQNHQEQIWHDVKNLFGITPAELWQVRKYLEDHLSEIVTDALQGQCTAGHSCKSTSRQTLQALLATTTSSSASSSR